MKKQMEPLAVEVSDDGLILISRYGKDDRDFQPLEIAPEQVEGLIAWLQEAKEEAKTKAKVTV